jgi:hypothetical protein
MDWLTSSRTMITTSLILVPLSFLIANSGDDLGVEDTLGLYHAVHSFVPWLLQWGAIALLLTFFSQRLLQQREWLSPRIVLPWFGVGFVWWMVALGAIWNMTILDLLIDRVFSYASKTLGGEMNLLDWLLYISWIVNPYQASVPFSLVGWGGVTALVHSLTATVVCCGLSYLTSREHFRTT